MRTMKVYGTLWLVLALLSLLSACGYGERAVPPSSIDLGNNVGEMYLRTGVATKIVNSDILGKHYRPGRDSWKVIACTEFGLADGGTGKDCNDSFELYKLDSGTWMVSGTVNGQYIWVEML